MALLLVVLLLAVLFGAAGFAVHLLWIVAVIIGIAWLAGFVFRGAESARWYRW